MKVIGIDSAETIEGLRLGFIVDEDLTSDFVMWVRVDGYNFRYGGRRALTVYRDTNFYPRKKLDELSIEDVQNALHRVPQLIAEGKVERARSLQSISQKFGLPLDPKRAQNTRMNIPANLRESSSLPRKGAYSIMCCVASREEKQASINVRLKHGYGTAGQAFAALPMVAAAEGVSAQECIVIRLIDANEADDFVS